MSRFQRHHKALLGLVSFLFIWVLISTTVQARDLTQASTVTSSDLILAMNTLRVSYGLPALIEDPIINAVAQNTAEIMAANNMSSHIGDVRGRLAAAGYGGGAIVWATENFAVGYFGTDEIMQVWADPTHMLPATNPAYCNVGAGVAQASEDRYYYILQAAYISGQACGEYTSVVGDTGTGTNFQPPVSQIIIPVKIATPDADGRVYHIVQPGQSFWAIAIAYQITIRDLEVWNNLSRDNPLYPGQKLFIPTSNTKGYATPTPVGMVIVTTPDSEGRIVHEVQPYQVLIKIAKAYNVSLDRILALNGLQADWPLQIGQKILIDPGKVTPSPTPRPLTAIEKLTPASDGNFYHTIQSGEYLAWIADLYQVRLVDLVAWNDLAADSIIRPGQRLLLRVTPPATNTPTPGTPSATPTVSVTPPAFTSTESLTPTMQITVPPSEIEDQSILSTIGIPLLITLGILGMLVLGWVRRRGGDE